MVIDPGFESCFSLANILLATVPTYKTINQILTLTTAMVNTIVFSASRMAIDITILDNVWIMIAFVSRFPCVCIWLKPRCN